MDFMSTANYNPSQTQYSNGYISRLLTHAHGVPNSFIPSASKVETPKKNGIIYFVAVLLRLYVYWS